MKILCLASNVPGVNLYRVYQQAIMLKKAGHDVYVRAPKDDHADMGILGLTWVMKDWLKWVERERPDVIYANYSADMERLAALIMFRDKLGIPFVVDVDDYFDAIPLYNQASRTAVVGSKRRIYWRAWLKEASMVTSTTRTLGDLFSMDTRVVPNFTLPMLYGNDRQQHDTMRIVFTGAAAGRWAEMEFLRPVIEHAVKTYDHARFIFTGAMPDWALDLPHVHTVAWCGVPGYFRLLNYVAPDIGLAPLVDNPFNRGKSAVKYLEYGMVGAAGIYSDLPPYEPVQDGKTGIVLPNDPDAWIQAVDSLVNDLALRRSIALAAEADIVDNHSGTDALSRALTEVVHAGRSHGVQPDTTLSPQPVV